MTDLQPTKKRNNDIVNTLMGALLLIAMMVGLFYMNDGSNEVVTVVDMSDSLFAEPGQLPAAEPTVDPSFVDASAVIVEEPVGQAEPIEAPANESTLIDSTFIMLGVGLLIVIALIGWLLSRIRKPSNVAKTGTVEAGTKAQPANSKVSKAQPQDKSFTILKAIIEGALNSRGGSQPDGSPNFWINPHRCQTTSQGWTFGISYADGVEPGDLAKFERDIDNRLFDAGFIDEERGGGARVRIAPLSIEIDNPSPTTIALSDWWDALLAATEFTYSPGVIFSRKNGESLLTNRMGDSNEFSALFFGASGSGKTQAIMATLLSMCASTSPEKLSVIVVDPKAMDFPILDKINLPHLACPVITDATEACNAVLQVVAEMDRRVKDKDSSKADRRIVLVIDELKDLIDQQENAEEIIKALGRLGQKGRAWGFNMLLGSQRAVKESMPKDVKANVPVTLVGRVKDQNESFYASDDQEAKCHKLPGRGAFKVFSPDRLGIRLQSFFVVGDKDPNRENILRSFVDGIRGKFKGAASHYTLIIDAELEEEGTGTHAFPTDGFDSNLFEPEPEPAQVADPIEGLIAKYGKEVVAAWVDEWDRNGGEITGARITAIRKEMAGKGLDGTTAGKIRDILCSGK